MPSGKSESDVKSVTPLSPSLVVKRPPTGVLRSRFSLRSVVLIALPLLSLLGGYGTWALASSNGTLDHIFALVASQNPKFPGTNEALVNTYTTISWLDKPLTVLVVFFAPVVSRDAGALTLFSRFVAGQFGGAWTLIVMEGLRVGNRGRFVSHVATMGLIFQNISYTVTVPIWLFLHLLTSPVARPIPGVRANQALLIDRWDLLVLPYSIALGFLLPTMLMGVDHPRVVSPRAHQQWIAFWQPFPLWTVMAHSLLRPPARWLSSLLHGAAPHPRRAPAAPGESYLSRAKHVYRCVLILCIITHVPTLLLALLPPRAVPASMPQLAALASHSLSSVYAPGFPPTSSRVSSLAEGVHTFLAWDAHVGSLALLCWAILLHRNATTEKSVVDPDGSLPTHEGLLLAESTGDGMAGRRLLGRLAMWTVAGGPIAAVAVLLWERDAIVRQKIKQGM